MNKLPIRQLCFSAADDIVLAAVKGRLGGAASKVFVADDLGPLLEVMHFSKTGLMKSIDRNPWISLGRYKDFYSAFQSGRISWVDAQRNRGFFRSGRIAESDPEAWLAFCVETQRAAQGAGIPQPIAAGLVGAIGELESNIHEHSGLPETGFVAFRAELGVFEFVVADHGVGILRSLKRFGKYKDLFDHGKALELALSDGVSAIPDEGRGKGFRQLFIGLANLNGSLRFRSGDQAIIINGRSANLMSAQLTQKANIDGFFASVLCSP